MLSITEERLRELIEDFGDWVSCRCSECRLDARAHAINEYESLAKLADYVIKELKNDSVKT